MSIQLEAFTLLWLNRRSCSVRQIQCCEVNGVVAWIANRRQRHCILTIPLHFSAINLPSQFAEELHGLLIEGRDFFTNWEGRLVGLM